MNLPVDFKEVIDEAVNIDAARHTALSVSVLIDGTAPADVVAHVRALFASAALHARVTVGYLDGAQLASDADDIAVLVAGLDMRIGAKAAEIRVMGVPVMVVTTLPDQVARLADESGYPIPQGDLISPELSDDEKSQAQEAFEAFFGKISAPDAIDLVVEERKPAHARRSIFLGDPEGKAGEIAGEAFAVDADNHMVDASAALNGAHDAVVGGLQKLDALRGRTASARIALAARAKTIDVARFLKRSGAQEKQPPEMPNLLNEDAKRAFNNRMGEWIIATCHEKRLSFALAFPFVARPLSLEAVNATAVQNAGIGVVIFLPGADMPVMTANQMKMILQIAAAYGQPITIERAKELLAVLGGAFAARTAARNVAGLVPGLGWAVKGTIGYTATLAMGRAAIEYFENGTGLMGATGAVVSAKNAAVKAVENALGVSFATQPQSTEERNQQTVETMKSMASGAANTAKNFVKAAGPLGQQLIKGARQSFADGIRAMKR